VPLPLPLKALERGSVEQVIATAGAFTKEHLAKAVYAIYETDKKFRDGYRDDRVIMESLVLMLTASGDLA
jgi:hypothetical protein